MEIIDKKCVLISNFVFMVFSYIFIPLKISCKIFTGYFQRPYSFMFVLDFLILIPPAILLLGMCYQFFDFLNITPDLGKYFYFALVNLIGNFVFVFHLYHLNNIHRLEDVNKTPLTAKSFTKKTFSYLFYQTWVGWIGLYLLLQLLICFYGLHFIHKELYDDKTFDIPILSFCVTYGLFMNILFSGVHILIYSTLFVFILLEINNSCICLLIRNAFSKTIYQDTIREENTKINFSTIALRGYKFFGIYDYEKELNINYNVYKL
jgi:hypothetical protein